MQAHPAHRPPPADNQKLGVFLPLLLLIMGSYPPLTTDMYLPALPQLARTFDTPETTANLTLVLFFVFFAFSTLIWGPLSEKFGRRPSLIVGISIYTLASAGCAWAGSVHQMILFRVIQAIASGAPVTIALAIVQDTYKGDAKKKILSILGALMMVAPVVGPSIGSAVLAVAHWRVIFILLLGLGALSLIGCLFLKETCQTQNDQSLVQVFSGLFTVLKVPFFRRSLLIFSMPAVYAFAFIGGSAIIFMSDFGISANTFSLYFGINAGAGILGAILYVPVIRRFSFKTATLLSFAAIGVSGFLIVCFGQSNPLLFLLAVLPGSVTASLLRPLGLDPMMEAVQNDPGSASSMINFFTMLVGSAGMQLISMEWSDRTCFYGVLAIGVSAFCLLMWPWVNNAMVKDSNNGAHALDNRSS